MNRSFSPAGVGLAAALLAGPAVAQDVAAWNADRAAVFSQVCMTTAPGFEDLGAAAGRAGFRADAAMGGLLRDPEIVVSLLQEGQSCACRMTMGAPDQAALVAAVFQTLMADFPNAWAPASRQGTINDTVFQREGERVRLLLIPFESDGQPWIEGRVIAEGACRA